jgi:hypothetical protein
MIMFLAGLLVGLGLAGPIFLGLLLWLSRHDNTDASD